MYQMFFEPNVVEVTVGSILRVDTKDIGEVAELKGFEFNVVDSFEDTHYIIPIAKKGLVKPKAKLEYFTSGGDMNFDYAAGVWSRSSKVRNTCLQVMCEESELNEIIRLMGECGLELSECPDEELNGSVVTYTDVFLSYDAEAYREFKNALKNIK